MTCLLRATVTSGYSARVVKVGVACATVLLLVSGCGGYDPDEAAIQKAIEKGIVDQQGDDPQDFAPLVTCPDPISWEAGKTFHCDVSGVLYGKDHNFTDANQVTVFMENDEGQYTWELDTK